MPLRVCLRDPQPDFPMHSHGFNELVIILKGTAMHLIDGQDFPIRTGDVFVLSPDNQDQYVEMNGLARPG